MENFKQVADLDIPNSESNTETEFSRQVEECQTNLYRIEKLFFDLQRDSQRLIRKSQDSLAKSSNSNKKKCGKRLNEQPTVQELHCKAHDENQFCSNNNSELKHDTSASVEDVRKGKSSSPLTFIVQVPSSIVDDLKKKFSSSDFLNFLSQCSSSQNFKIKKKKGISSLFQKLFKRKKNNVPPNLNTLLLKNMKFIKFSTEPDQNEKQIGEKSKESNIDQTSVPETTPPIENNTDVNLSNSSKNTTDNNNNSSDGQTLVIPINFNSNTNIQDHVKSNLIIQHEIASTNISNQCTHTIKIRNEPLLTCHSISQCPSKVIVEKEDNEEKELENCSFNKLRSEKHLMKNFIDNLLKSTENLNNLEILKIVVEILHEEKLKRKPSCGMDYCNTKMKNDRESNFLHNFLQQLMVELQNKTKQVDKSIGQTPRRQSSKISICPSTGGLSSEEDCFEKPAVQKSKRFHKNTRRCQSPSMLKYRFCQSEKDFEKIENTNKWKGQVD